MKRAFAFLLVLVMMLGCFAGCGNSGESANNEGEMPTVRMVYEMEALDDQEMIEEAMSKYTQEKIGCKLELIPIPYASYGEQVNLITSSTSDPVDIIMMEGWSGVTAPVLAAKGAIMPITDLVDQYAPGAKEAVGQFLESGVIDGELYQLPTIKNLALQYGVVMRKDLVEKYNIDLDSIKTEEDLTAVFETVSAGEPGMIMVSPEGVNLWLDSSEYDQLGDKIGVLENRGTELKVVDLVETELYAKQSRLHSEWYQKGYIAQDIMTSPDSVWDLISAGKQFAVLCDVKPGFIDEKYSATGGVELVQVDLSVPFTFTSRASTYGWAIAHNAPNPELAMQVIELMFTDPDFLNILDWGIEGVHYEKVEGYDNIIRYPEGVNSDNCGYAHGNQYAYGNQLISYIREGSDPTLYEQLDAWNKSADVSKAMGFVWDYTTVKTEYTAVSNVNEKYLIAISLGVLDYDTYIEEYKAELKKAGNDIIIAEKQRQLDEWAKANGIQ